MAAKKTSNKVDKNANLKPGSNPEDAARVGGKGDFGVPERNVVGRTYTSRNTKASDPGAAQAHGGEGDNRTTGVGGTGSGVGASSGGDLDTDFVGLDGSGLTASGADRQHHPGPDDSDGSSNEFAGGPPAQGRNQDDPRPQHVKGTTHQPPDEQTLEGGADDATNARGATDSFAGEISSGEASGGDSHSAAD